jgi:F-type H+-transporting ATPase subunit a
LEETHGSLLEWLYTLHILPDSVPRYVPHSVLVILILVVLSILATRNIKKTPGGMQNAMEWVVEGLENFSVDAMGGPEGRAHAPIIGSFFLYILFMNLIGLIPGMISPTTKLSTTVALALVAIVYVHYNAIRTIGVKTWASHFVGEPLWMAPLMIPIHIMGEFARPLSLSFRLFGNIYGEDVVIVILAAMSPVLAVGGIKFLALPVQFPMLVFSAFTDVLQAFVFTLLVAIYISVTVGDHAHEHDVHHEQSEALHSPEPVHV